MYNATLMFAFGLLIASTSPTQSFTSQPLPTAAGWRAALIHEATSGIWYAHVANVVDAYGQPEVICADDQGNLKVLSVYSGTWTTHQVNCEAAWLAPSLPADVDPRIEGHELYAAGRSGAVFQVTMRTQPAARFTLESREVGHVAGEEFHAVVAADLIPGGNAELLMFGITGAVYLLVPDAHGPGFDMRKVAQLPGRVRAVAVLPAVGDGPATMLGASRSGHLLQMQLNEAGALRHQTILREDCGLGRITLGREHPDRMPGPVYVTRDDGVLLRITLGDNDALDRQIIYAGGQGLRGVAAGKFFTDDREAVAVCGYDRRVHMISKASDAADYVVETILQDEQKGHWLTTGELDGRNSTDELIVTGFDGKVAMLSRPPGYGLQGVAVPEEAREPAPVKKTIF